MQKFSFSFPTTPQLAVVGSLLAFVAGLGLVVQSLATSTPSVAVETEARAGGLSAWVTRYEWLEHDHDAAADNGGVPLPPVENAAATIDPRASQGYAMPASMMPGTPDEGYARLQVELDIMNRSSGQQRIDISQFHLRGEDGRTWPTMGGGTFKPTTLSEGLVYSTVTAFDVETEAADQTMYLVWRANGEETLFLVSEGAHH